MSQKFRKNPLIPKMYNTLGKNKHKGVKKIKTLIFWFIGEKVAKKEGFDFFDHHMFVFTPSIIHFWNQWIFSEFLRHLKPQKVQLHFFYPKGGPFGSDRMTLWRATTSRYTRDLKFFVVAHMVH